MTRKVAFIFLNFTFFIFILLQFNCSSKEQKKLMTNKEKIAEGKYLVDFGGCNDCHSPKVFTNLGPISDKTRLLSGHPAEEKLKLKDLQVLSSNWIHSNLSGTAWVGSWGVSFAANLTPDGETGLGNWNEEVFIKTFWTGKHMGIGRNLLPPMPWQAIGQLNNEDLKAIFAYLKSLTPVKNQVPDPIPPNGSVRVVNKE
jgi:hypothetical protein